MQSTHGDADTSAILEFWNQYAATWEAVNIDVWTALWTEDGVQLPPGAPANVGKEQIRKSNGVVLDQWSFHTAVHPEEVGGSGEWAYCWGRYTQTSTAKVGGDSEHLDAKFMSILRKQPDGSWKLHRDAFNSNVS